MATTDDLRDLPRFPPLLVAASLGALWGAMGYAILWGLTPITVSRQFVLSFQGTLALLPVRLVLWSIKAAEGLAGRHFHFPDFNWWIGAVAAGVGAGMATAAVALGRFLLRRARAAGA